MGRHIPKIFIDARTLMLESVRLAHEIWCDGFRPDFLIGIWRGGTLPAILIHEYFRLRGIDPYHTVIKTRSYQGMQRRSASVEVKGLGHIIALLEPGSRVLIVDDVFDTGRTMESVIEQIRQHGRRNDPELRVATAYYKPQRNETAIRPDYWQVETDEWIVFPHEIEGLSDCELRAKSEAIYKAVKP